MVALFTVRDVSVDIDEETDEIMITLVGGSGNVYELPMGKYARNDTTAQQRRQIQKINAHARFVRDYFIRKGSMPPGRPVKTTKKGPPV